MHRIFPILMGVVGVAILLGLGVWQVQRLAWKERVLSQIEAAMAAAPEALPATAEPEADAYRAVTLTGRLAGEELPIFWQAVEGGAGYRIVAALEVAGAAPRRVLVDLGYADEARRAAPVTTSDIDITGHLHWPDEVNRWTPEQPDSAGVWYARDVAGMAAALDTEPLLVVVNAIRGDSTGTTLVPLSTDGIKNDHLNYAITWFLLAAVWAGMSIYLVVRTRKAT